MQVMHGYCGVSELAPFRAGSMQVTFVLNYQQQEMFIFHVTFVQAKKYVVAQHADTKNYSEWVGALGMVSFSNM